MKTKIVALALAVLSAMLIVSVVSAQPAPTATKGPRMDVLVEKFYANQGALYTGYMSPEPNTIDFMAWPITKAQYDEIKNDPAHQFYPYDELGSYEIDINNNETMPTYPDVASYISPTNYTEFRQAMGYCVDKEWLLTAIVQGLGTRLDTPMPRLFFDKSNPDWIEWGKQRWGLMGATDLGNYPYEYDPEAAAALFDAAGFVEGTTPNPDYDSGLPWSTPHIRVYPATQPIRHWKVERTAGTTVTINIDMAVVADDITVIYTPLGKGDHVTLRRNVDYTYSGTVVTITGGYTLTWPAPTDSHFTLRWKVGERANPRAGQDLDPLMAYLRSDHQGRLEAGRGLCTHLKKLGIPVQQNELTSGGCYGPVFVNRDFHIYTGGWSYARYPTHFVSMYTPVGIYPDGGNYPMIDNPAINYWAFQQYYYNRDADWSIMAARMCQELLVDECCIVWLYANKGFFGYKAGWLGVAPTAGYGFQRIFEYMWLNVYNENPAVDTVRYGLMRPPIELNPIFSYWQWEYEVLDQIIPSGFMQPTPSKPSTPGKSPVGSDQAWLAKDWKHEWIDSNSDGVVNEGDRSKVTLWVRSDLVFTGNGTWGPRPVTLDDWEYVHWVGKSYVDCTFIDTVINLESITKYPAENKIEFVYSAPSFWSLYWPVSPYPKDILESISDHHTGIYGGMGDLPLEDTLIGCAQWKFRAGSYVAGAGGGVVLDANRDFHLEPLLGDIDFAYFFNAGTPPQGGSYKIGLADLVTLAKAYGSKGNADPAAGGSASPNWNSACDLAKPVCVVGLADLVTLAKVYGQTWGQFT